MKDIFKYISWQAIATIFGLWGILFSVLSRMGISFFYSIITIIIPFLSILVIVLMRVLKEFEFVARSECEGCGDELIKYIKKSKNRIYVTHFRKERPSDTYRGAMHDARKNNANIDIRRVVGFKKDDLEKHKEYPWANWIIEEIKENHAKHRFLDLKDKNILFEILVFDNVGVLALPSKDVFHEGILQSYIISLNKEFVDALVNMFTGYWDQAEL